LMCDRAGLPGSRALPMPQDKRTCRVWPAAASSPFDRGMHMDMSLSSTGRMQTASPCFAPLPCALEPLAVAKLGEADFLSESPEAVATGLCRLQHRLN